MKKRSMVELYTLPYFLVTLMTVEQSSIKLESKHMRITIMTTHHYRFPNKINKYENNIHISF